MLDVAQDRTDCHALESLLYIYGTYIRLDLICKRPLCKSTGTHIGAHFTREPCQTKSNGDYDADR